MLRTTRRTFIKVAGSAIVTTSLLGLGSFTQASPDIVRPPGAVAEQDFKNRCLRCHQCIDACPEKALSSGHITQGWNVTATPVLTSACTLCMKCTEQCPSGALARIKSQDARMGTAFILEKECVGCDKCIKPCPTGAIKKVPGKRLVAVDAAKCTGCMMCVKHCPVTPVAIKITPEGAKRPKVSSKA